MNQLSTLGLDVSKASVTVCFLEDYPDGGPDTFWRLSQKNKRKYYPQFFSIPGKGQTKNAFDFAEFVKGLKRENLCAVVEPTGVHYSRLWASILESLGVKILWVGHVELRRYRESLGLPNKSDFADALALACYPLEPRRWQNGELNPKHFLLHRPKSIDRLRELCQQIEHLNRVQSPIINYARQLLSWQFPEKAQSDSSTDLPGMLPPLWGWLAGEPTASRVTKKGLTQIKNAYAKSIAVQYDIEIDDYLREHAQWLCDIQDSEERIENQITKLLDDSCFSLYHQIFDRFGFGLRIRANVLSRIYPFESFLTEDVRELIEYEHRDVREKKRSRSKDGRVVITKGPAVEKRSKRNRSRDAFKMRLGLGTILEQSGDLLVEKTSGSQLSRSNLWRWVYTSIEVPNRAPDTPEAKALVELCAQLKGLKGPQGEQLLNGKLIQSKLASKAANMLYAALVKVIARKTPN